MLILLSRNEQGISALDLQKHIFPSGSSSMKSTFPWMQRHYVNYYKGEQLYETNRRETALTHPRKSDWLAIRTMRPCGAACLHMDCYFSELALLRFSVYKVQSTKYKADIIIISLNVIHLVLAMI